MSVLGWLVLLVLAAIGGDMARVFFPGRLPGGFLVAMTLGFAGAWLGVEVAGAFGPSLGGVPLLPAVLGSVITVAWACLVSGRVQTKKCGARR
ncbi:MAG: GlsB/YeaQ/YmgE family stress response membrane protein [Vulcanimicrobiota bacterium]